MKTFVIAWALRLQYADVYESVFSGGKNNGLRWLAGWIWEPANVHSNGNAGCHVCRERVIINKEVLFERLTLGGSLQTVRGTLQTK